MHALFLYASQAHAFSALASSPHIAGWGGERWRRQWSSRHAVEAVLAAASAAAVAEAAATAAAAAAAAASAMATWMATAQQCYPAAAPAQLSPAQPTDGMRSNLKRVGL
jgi:hypothetical protein